MTLLRTSAPLLALLIAGCAGASDNQAASNEAAAPSNQIAPTEANVSKPVGEVSTGDSLAAYAGKYPTDEVDGETFLGDVRVRAAVAAAVPDAEIRGRILGPSGPTTPIRSRAGRLQAWGCEAHDCGPHNWTIFIDESVDNIEICYHDAATMQGQSRWYRADRAPEMRDADCPSE